jgi:hypothetical protein
MTDVIKLVDHYNAGEAGNVIKKVNNEPEKTD